MSKFPIVSEITDQVVLKHTATLNQKGRCMCGSSLFDSGGELHHALLSRKDVQGSYFKDIIHHTCNVIVCCKGCHENATREKSKDFLFEIFGEDVVRVYYDNAVSNFKSTMRQI